MYEKVNKYHPDKVADRIAGAIVDEAYRMEENPKIAVEVLIGHGTGLIIIESSVKIDESKIGEITERIAGIKDIKVVQVPQDKHLAENQENEIKCGDNGIFKGAYISDEERTLARISRYFEDKYKSDGKYIIVRDYETNEDQLTICQSQMRAEETLPEKTLITYLYPDAKVNPLGYWEGGTDTDSGATNRKLGSDMGRGATGGGLHGKDLSKADVSINIVCHLFAQEGKTNITATCSIGDTSVKFLVEGKENEGRPFEVPYEKVVQKAKKYIESIGGFEKFAEYGLIR